MRYIQQLFYIALVAFIVISCSEQTSNNNTQSDSSDSNDSSDVGNPSDHTNHSDDTGKKPEYPNTLDMDCYQQCIDKGAEEDVCLFFCSNDEDKEPGKDEDIDEDSLNPLTSITLDVEGETRHYRLFVPTTSNPSMPLIVFFHGGGGRDFSFPQQVAFQNLAEEQGILLAFAMGEIRTGEEGEWLLNTTAERQQDVKYIRALIADISSKQNVDSTRMYAVGYSLGSMYTYEVACHLSDHFAAIASHAGSMPISPASCEQSKPVAVMHIHGTDDSIIPYDTTWDWKMWDIVGQMHDIPSLIQYWSDKYNCQVHNDEDLGSSTHIVHSECNADVRVEHHRLLNVGHEWPQAINTVTTPQVIWSFLSAFNRP